MALTTVATTLFVAGLSGIRSVWAVSLTASSPSSSIASLSLISNGGKNTNQGSYFNCINDEYNSQCLELSIPNLQCVGKEIITISLDTTRVSGDTDQFTLVSVENDIGEAEYFGIANDYDGGMGAWQTSTLGGGGVFVTPPCGVSTLNTVDDLDTMLDDVTSPWGHREPFAGGDETNYGILTGTRVGISSRSNPVSYVITNNVLSDTASVSFSSSSTASENLECVYGTSLPTDNGNDYRITLGIDAGTYRIYAVDVTTDCQEPTDSPTKEPTEEVVCPQDSGNGGCPLPNCAECTPFEGCGRCDNFYTEVTQVCNGLAFDTCVLNVP